MPDLVDHVGYLSRGIGPRPAGTEEEQQAAFFIADQLQQEAGLQADVEDFDGMQNGDTARVILCVVAVVVTVLSMVFPSLEIVALVVTIITAVLFATEEFGKPILSRAFAHGVSQNVIAKYEPSYTTEGNNTRRRKIVVVARYDTGKVRPQYSGAMLKLMPVYQWACLISMIALPVLLLVRNVLISDISGTALVVMNVLLVVAMVSPIILLVLALMDKVGNYSEGANCNATGTAALVELARRVNRGYAYGYAEGEYDGEGADIHGESAARAAGLVPEGAQLVYEASQVMPPERAPQTPEERLASAKAAVAALTGKPVSSTTYVSDLADNLVQPKDWSQPELSPEERLAHQKETRDALDSLTPEAREEVLAQAEAVARARAEEAESTEEAQTAVEDAYIEVIDAYVAGVGSKVGAKTSQHDQPKDEEGAGEEQPTAAAAVQEPKKRAPEKIDNGAVSFEYVPGAEPGDAPIPVWYKTAQEKAKRPTNEKPVHRSRYADSLDAAMSESSGYFAAANTIVERKLEESLDMGRDEIREVKAPAWAIPSNNAQAPAAKEAAAEGEAAEKLEAAAVKEEEVLAPAAEAPVAAPVAPAAEAAEAAEEPLEPVEAPAPASEKKQVPLSAQTTAFMPVIKVETPQEEPLRVEPMPGEALPVEPLPADQEDIPMPSFLSGKRAQGEARQDAAEEPRTSKRVTVGSVTVSPEDMASSQASGPVSYGRSGAAVHSYDLPTAGVSQTGPVNNFQTPKQRAPLAEAQSSGTAAAKSLLTMLPTIDVAGGDDEAASTQAATEGQEGADSRASLRSSLPSLSGPVGTTGVASSPSSTGAVSAVGSFVSAGATGAFAPVGDELIENVAPEDIYVDDADDSAFVGNVTQTGAIAGPDYVKMPKNRKERFFGRFRHKKKGEEISREDEQTPQEWLNVDESFDPRAVGAERGGWESFQGESGYAGEQDYGQQYDQQYDQRQYDQGYSQQQYDQQQYYDQGYGDQGYGGEYRASYDEAFNDEDFGYNDAAPSSDHRRWQGGAYSADQAAGNDGFSDGFSGGYPESYPEPEGSYAEEARPEDAYEEGSPSYVAGQYPDGMAGSEVPDEVDQVQRFRGSGINTEVWFVALGSELAKDSGMRAFLNEHATELKGAMIVDIEALGGGDLCLIDREGCYNATKTSSRMGRLARKASQASGVKFEHAQIRWGESASSVAIRRGYQAMHFVGMEGDKPALYAQEDDVIENVDFNKLSDNIDFLMELLRNI